MPTRTPRGTDFVNHQTAELHDAAAHAHETGQLHGKQDHLTGTEHARQDFERLREERQAAHQGEAGHGIHSFNHDDIALLAHSLWVARGCPEGSPEVDWFEAVKELRKRAMAHEEIEHPPTKVLSAGTMPPES
jgi:hypothetical protein